jgi:anti-sigma factor RsiW
MSCSPFDLKEYFLKELSVPQAAEVEGHVHSCSGCREELERLQLTEAALFSLRDEEIPQRIAFVSDKIFEPSPMRRWFSTFWGSAGRLGFASAAMLSAAIVFSSVNKPAPAPVPGPTVIEKVAAGPAPEEIQARIDAAVAKAVDQAVTQSKETRQLVADLGRENEQTRSMLVRAAGEIEMYQKRDRNSQMAHYREPDWDKGEAK